MKAALSNARDSRVIEILKWSEWLRENLRYPNSENSRDEARYTEIFEEKILEIINRKM